MFYLAAAVAACDFPAASIARPSPELTASTTRRSSALNASWFERYNASTAVIPEDPSRGTASAERSVLYFVGSFKYPGSTDGLPFRIGFVILRHPSRQSFANGNSQRRKQPEIFSAHKLRNQEIVLREHKPPWNRAAPDASIAPRASRTCPRRLKRTAQFVA